MQRRQKPIGIIQAILCSIFFAVILQMFGVSGDWAVWVGFGIGVLGYIGSRLPQTSTSASASSSTLVATLREARRPPPQMVKLHYSSDRVAKAEFPFPKQVVFRALCDAVTGIKGMEVAKRDELACHLDVKTGASAFSWGEKVSVSISDNVDQTAVMLAHSSAKTSLGSTTASGKNQKNINRIMTCTSELLQEHGARWHEEMGLAMTDTADQLPTAAEIIADELAKLAQLRDQGILNEGEFQSQKARLLR